MLKKLLFRLVKRYRHSTVPTVLVLLIDLATLVALFFIVELLQTRHGIWMPHAIIIKMTEALAIATLCYLIIGTHKNIIRHSGLNDIILILIANIIPTVILIGGTFFSLKYNLTDDHIIFSYRESVELFSLQALTMIITRLLLQRIYNDYFRKRRPRVNVIIYGAGAAGIIAYNALKQDIRYEYNVVAYIDDDEAKLNQKLNAVPVIDRKSVV